MWHYLIFLQISLVSNLVEDRFSYLLLHSIWYHIECQYNFWKTPLYICERSKSCLWYMKIVLILRTLRKGLGEQESLDYSLRTTRHEWSYADLVRKRLLELSHGYSPSWICTSFFISKILCEIIDPFQIIPYLWSLLPFS